MFTDFRHRRLWPCLLLLLLLIGCASHPVVERSQADLIEQLCALDHSVDMREAEAAAETACSRSRQLAEEYRVVGSPLFHNLLINVGLRKRGLCYQWADDLTAALETLDMRTLELHRGIAHLGSLREHSSVVVTAPGQPFKEGILLDAWRYSGNLYWGPVASDKYPWKRVELKNIP
jgi:hypothetical protein